MYLVKRLCGLTLQQTADRFGLGSYGAVGWACNRVKSKMELKRAFKKQMEKIQALAYQQKI